MARVHVNKVIEVCDFCQRDGYLERCLLCRKQMCLICVGLIAGCMVSLTACKKCSHRADVVALVKQYADKIVPLIKRRDAAVRNLPKYPSLTEGTDG